jgi:hypothetical protein
MNFHIVITTIQEPTESILKMARAAEEYQARMWIIGDRKGPETFELNNATFISIEAQSRLPFGLVESLPENHYSRKNIGYLEAIRNGAECLFETDDDNHPLASWSPIELEQDAVEVSQTGWCNVYRYFTDETIWPRGFPLEHIHRDVPSVSELKSHKGAFPIQQQLADGSPDVDAIWRLVCAQEVCFEGDHSVALSPGTWCPFNSQATWWWPEAYPFLYLPSYCSSRMTDIWRSFVAQRCLWAEGAGLLFHKSGMLQERNDHNLMKDFEDEVGGYLKNAEIARCLGNVSLQRGRGLSNLMACYQVLIREGLIPDAELDLVEAWCQDLRSLQALGAS